MKTASRPIKLYIFYCSNNFDIDEFNLSFKEETGDIHKPISLPCSGKADLLYFMKAFETGADGLILVTCPKNKCRYLEGNLRAPKRAEQVDEILAEIGIADGRVLVLTAGNDGVNDIVAQASLFRDRIRITPPGATAPSAGQAAAQASLA